VLASSAIVVVVYHGGNGRADVCDEIHRNLKRLIQILGPDFIVMMEAYFDESGTHEGSPVMCVVGYLFTAEQALHLDREWAATLDQFGLDHFHAADCAHGVGPFSALNREQRRDLIIKLVGIIKRRMEIGIAVSVSETDFGKTAPPKWEKAGPYSLAALHVLAGVVSWAHKRDYTGKISYFFEAGHKHQRVTNTAIEWLTQKGSDYLRYHSHTFAGKKELRPLQAADLLAYEWQKELRRINVVEAKRRPMRRSLESLLEQSHITQHFGVEDLYKSSTQGHAALGDRMIRFDLIE